MARPTKGIGPLPRSQLHILLALADGEKHGYAVMKEVESMTGGEVTMGPGAVYTTIKRLLELGLIVEAGDRVDASDEKRRRYYRATPNGLAVLASETERLARLIRTAEEKRSRALTPKLGDA